MGGIPEARQVNCDLVDLNFRQIKEEVRQLFTDRFTYMQVPLPWPLIVSRMEGIARKRQLLG